MSDQTYRWKPKRRPICSLPNLAVALRRSKWVRPPKQTSTVARIPQTPMAMRFTSSATRVWQHLTFYLVCEDELMLQVSQVEAISAGQPLHSSFDTFASCTAIRVRSLQGEERHGTVFSIFFPLLHPA